MSTDFYDLAQAAFEKSLEAMTVLPTHPTTQEKLIAYENVVFTPADGVGWVRGTFAPIVSDRETAGDAGYSRIDGLYQVSVFWPIGKGTGEPRRLADAIIRNFKSGTVLSEGGITLTIAAAWRGVGTSEDEWYHIPVTVEWYAHHNEV
jgi:hypothetical protein